MRRWHSVLGSVMLALFAVPYVIAAVSGPVNVSTPADALAAAGEVAKALSAHNYAAAAAFLLLIIGWAFKQPWLGSLFSKIPPNKRALAMLIVGGLTTSAAMYLGGTPIFDAIISGAQSALGATGLYEIWQGLTSKAPDYKAEIARINAIADPAAKATELAALANKL